jgi:hypothetical protein
METAGCIPVDKLTEVNGWSLKTVTHSYRKCGLELLISQARIYHKHEMMSPRYTSFRKGRLQEFIKINECRS